MLENFNEDKRKNPMTQFSDFDSLLSLIFLRCSRMLRISYWMEYKTESDMKEVIMEIRNMESKFDSKFDAIESKFSILLWVVGTVGFVITIMITIFKFIG